MLHIVAGRSDEKGSGHPVFDALCRLLAGNSGQAVPSVTHDPTTGNTFEIWFKDCTIDRANGPAFIVRDAKTGIVTVEQWAPDRADGPSSIQRDAKTGIVTFEGWYRND